MTTLELIASALRIIGVLAEGETPSANMANDALVSFNQMVDSWNTERLSVYCTQTDIFTWPANTISLAYGPTGDIVSERPIIGVDYSTYYNYQNISYMLSFLNQQQYNSLALKTTNSAIPNCIFVNMEFPNIRMFLYPMPNVDLEFHLVYTKPILTGVALSDTISLPPGYLRALRYNLACEIAPEYDIEPSNQVKLIADNAKSTLKRVNNPFDKLFMPYFVLPRSNVGYGWNYYSNG